MSEAQKKLADAIARLAAATDVRNKALLAMDEAKAALASAHRDVSSARIEADGELEKCDVTQHSRDAATKMEWVVVKRSQKTVTARPIGSTDSYATSFRKSKHGRWTEYPAKKGGWNSSWLELEVKDAP